MNRSELQDQLIQQIIDDMDIKTMAALLYDMMDESYDNYSEKELIAEVEEYYPHILEESNTNLGGRGNQSAQCHKADPKASDPVPIIGA